jgi:hypothetical protein
MLAHLLLASRVRIQCLWRAFLLSLGFLSVQECSKANLHSSVASAATNWVASTKSWQVKRAAAFVQPTRNALSESYPGHPSKLASVKRVRRPSMRTGMRIVGACISLMVARYAGYFSTLGLPGTVEETLASASITLACVRTHLPLGVCRSASNAQQEVLAKVYLNGQYRLQVRLI